MSTDERMAKNQFWIQKEYYSTFQMGDIPSQMCVLTERLSTRWKEPERGDCMVPFLKGALDPSEAKT